MLCLCGCLVGMFFLFVCVSCWYICLVCLFVLFVCLSCLYVCLVRMFIPDTQIYNQENTCWAEEFSGGEGRCGDLTAGGGDGAAA